VHERLPEFLARLDEEDDASVQVALAELAAQFPEDGEASRPRLQRLLGAEADDRRRLVLEAAFAAVGGDVDDDVLCRIPSDYFDDEEIEELRLALAAGEPRTEIYRRILDNIAGVAITFDK
jgi:hypothetical protein